MFVVTWEHFAQGFSHSVFPNFFGGHWYGIAFCMPLFMVCSGWFTNFQKIKETSLLTYVSTRFNRLVIPALSFYLICCLILLAIPNPLHAITFFWYLTSLFVCQLIIAVVAKLVPNKVSLFIILPMIMLVPYTDFLKINFMFPFLLGGVFLRCVMKKEVSNLLMGCVAAIITGYLLVFWKVDYSVYKMPFNSASFDFMNLGILAYRFSLGFWGSWLFIIIAKFLTKFKLFSKIQ